MRFRENENLCGKRFGIIYAERARLVFLSFEIDEFFRFPFLPRKCASCPISFATPFERIASMQSAIASFSLFVHDISFTRRRSMTQMRARRLDARTKWFLAIYLLRPKHEKPTEFMADGKVDLAKYWLWLRSRATITHTARSVGRPVGRTVDVRVCNCVCTNSIAVN